MSRSHDDQASAKSFTELFRCSRWTQEELAEKEGRSQAWVTFRLRFGRFLHFGTMMGVRNDDPSLANLTERRFRALWAQTRMCAEKSCGSSRSSSSCVPNMM